MEWIHLSYLEASHLGSLRFTNRTATCRRATATSSRRSYIHCPRIPPRTIATAIASITTSAKPRHNSFT
nr:hypothetical protein [Cressdnaviricota sp.]UOF78505.1 hypothetical protein [Cressdnaviricota sp.]